MRIKPTYKYSIIKGEGLLLFEENGTTTLWGGIYEQLIPLLDGKRTIREIVNILTRDGDVNANHIYKSIMVLTKKNYLSVETTEVNEGELAFWSHLEKDDINIVYEKINSSTIRVTNKSSINDNLLKNKLSYKGFKISDSLSKPCQLQLLICDSYLEESIALDLRKMHKSGSDTMLLRPVGNEIWIGPIYKQGEKGCHDCLLTMHQRHNQARIFAKTNGQASTDILSPSVSIDSIHDIAFSIAAHEAMKYVVTQDSKLLKSIVTLNTEDLQLEKHVFEPYENCSTCNNIEIKNRHPLILKSSPTNHNTDGGYRKISPQETFDKYKNLVSRISGVVETITELKSPIAETYVYVAGYNSTRQVTNLNSLRSNLRSRNGGKGKSRIQAQVSALCESIERYSMEKQGDEPITYSSYIEMKKIYKDKVIHPNDIMLFSESQFKNKEELNLKSDNFNKVPNKLDEDKSIEWSPVWSVTKKTEKYLPTQLLYFYFKEYHLPEWIAVADSNGASSGNTLEEAIIQGFFEVVERDCTAIWWYNRLNYPEIDLDKSNDNWIQRIRTNFQNHNRSLWCIDITNDLGIPCFAAISKNEEEGSEQQILIGLGCHFDANIALQRSIAELNQMLGYLSNLENWNTSEAEDPDHTALWIKTATTEKHGYLLPDYNKPKVNINLIPNACTGDLINDLDICNKIIQEIGSEILVLDVTRSNVKMPVVKVMVPKLRHFYSRYAPGRLYDVPVKMGMLKSPKTEREMNPTSMFF